MTYVQYGCGFSAPDGWLNFDASPTLRIERLPLLGHLVHKNSRRFPQSVQFGDIVRGLPISDGMARGVYASHILEHLCREDFDIAVRNTFKMLQPGGVFRIVVPDMEVRARRYVSKLESGQVTANDWLMESAHLGIRKRPKTALDKMASVLGNSAHLWMWDFPALKHSLERTGFSAIRRCQYGDSGDPMFDRVEEPDRFYVSSDDFPELAVHAEKPV
jgi:hypothetical protein